MNKGYLFLNVDLPMVAWAAGRGVLVPARSGKNEIGWVSVMLASLIRNNKVSRLANERIIEAIRSSKYPSIASRMTGLFYFGDLDTAERAAKEWQHSFKLPNLTEIEIIGNEITSRFDSNWYTDAPRDSEGVFDPLYTKWIDSYLVGEPMPTKEPLWEYVTERRIKILNTELRKRAIEFVHKQFPESIILFEIACAGERAGFDVGNTSAFIQNNGDQYSLNWMLDMRDAENPAFLKRLEEPGMIGDVNEFSKRQLASGSFGRVPDLRPFGWRGKIIP
jgi:hypothetical protein